MLYLRWAKKRFKMFIFDVYLLMKLNNKKVCAPIITPRLLFVNFLTLHRYYSDLISVLLLLYVFKKILHFLVQSTYFAQHLLVFRAKVYRRFIPYYHKISRTYVRHLLSAAGKPATVLRNTPRNGCTKVRSMQVKSRGLSESNRRRVGGTSFDQ